MSNANWSPELEGRCPKPVVEKELIKKDRKNRKKLEKQNIRYHWPKTSKTYTVDNLKLPIEVSICTYEGRKFKGKDFPPDKHDFSPCASCNVKKLPFAYITYPYFDEYVNGCTLCEKCALEIGIKP